MTSKAELRLARLTQKGKVGRVVKCLDHPDPAVRREAVRRLLSPRWAKQGKDRSRWVTAALAPGGADQPIQQDHRVDVCLEPLVAYLPANPEDIAEVIAIAAGESRRSNLADGGEIHGAEAVLLALGEAAVGPLIGALTSDSGPVSAEAARMLGKVGDPRAVEPLVQVLRDERQKPIPASAARALGELGDQQAVEPLMRVFEENDAACSGAADALVALGDRRALGSLTDGLTSNYLDRRVAAARALGQFRESSTVPALVEALYDATGEGTDGISFGPGFRGYHDSVEEALERIASPEAERALAEYQGSDEYRIRKGR